MRISDWSSDVCSSDLRIDLAARAGDHPRLDSIARLEAAVLAQLPPGMMRPTDLVARALERVAHAHAVLGPLEIVGITELSPCWRPLLQELTAHTSVSWRLEGRRYGKEGVSTCRTRWAPAH